MLEQPSEAELHAYIDGHLDPHRMSAVEAFLAANPAVAARLRDYQRQKSLIAAGLIHLAGPVPPEAERLLDRLHRRLAIRRWAGRLGRLAAAFALVAIGWGIRGWDAPTSPAVPVAEIPLYADEAAEAHATASRLDPSMLAPASAGLAALAGLAADDAGEPIDLPHDLPNHALLGAMLVPWDEGTALQLVYREPDGELLTLFVAEEEQPRDREPRAVERDGIQLVYWQAGTVAYALGGTESADALVQVARAMAE